MRYDQDVEGATETIAPRGGGDGSRPATPVPAARRASPFVERTALAQLTLVRFREFIREPEAVFWTFLFPILLAAGLGLAFRSRPAEVVRVAVLSGAETAATALGADERVTVVPMADSAAATALRTGKVALVVAPGENGGVIYRFDDARPDARAARSVVDDVIQRAAGRADPVPVAETVVREPGARYIDFVIPGLLGMNLLGSGVWGIGFGIVDARKKKLLKRLIATPMSRAQYLLSFMFMRLLLLGVEVGTIVGFGHWVFGVPVRGSLITLGAVCVVSALSFGALGLLIASRARTMEGASGLMNLVMLPMWVFSGVFFSSSNFPDSMQPFVQALPLTAVIDSLRAIMLEGAGWPVLGGELAIIAAWAVGSFVLALRLFRWR
jgi:ABC-type multidrug transport system permease subunit